MQWNPYLSVAAAVRPTGKAQVIQALPASSSAASVTPAAWALEVATSGDLNGGFPYFDVPAGWPEPMLPEP